MYGWNEFIKLAASGDYDGAGEWIQGLAKDYGIQLTREEEDGLIELAGGEGVTTHELNYGWHQLFVQSK